MGIGPLSGSRSRNSQTTNQTDQSTTQTVGGDVSGGYQPLTVTGNTGPTTIEQTDFRAVQGGLGLASQALAQGTGLTSALAGQAFDSANTIAGKAFSVARDAGLSEGSKFQDTLLKIALIVATAFTVSKFAR